MKEKDSNVEMVDENTFKTASKMHPVHNRGEIKKKINEIFHFASK